MLLLRLLNCVDQIPGDYYYRMADEIRSQHQLVDEAHVQSSLFRCNANDTITYHGFCGDAQCHNSTSRDQSDRCWTPSSEIVVSSSASTSLSFPTVMVTSHSSAAVETQIPGQHPPGPVSHSNYIAIAVGVGVGVTVFVISVFVAAFWWLKRKRAKEVLEVLDSRAPSMRMYSPNSERGRTGYMGYGGKEW